jgi:hypothetical protein
MVPTAKFLLLRHLSVGEHRQGSVGGARHGIGQIGTGGWAAGIARHHSSEALSAFARGGIGGSGGI